MRFLSSRFLTAGRILGFTLGLALAAGSGQAETPTPVVLASAGTSQTITFNNPGSQDFGTSPTLTASASSGLDVTFFSDSPGFCTITSGGQLTFVQAGSCTIFAYQPGNAEYLSASPVSQEFLIERAPPSAPTNLVATAGDTQASIAFDPSDDNGGVPISGYYVTTSPADISPFTSTDNPIVVTGLTNGISYTFTLRADNGGAQLGALSAPSNAVTPSASQNITFLNPGAQDFGTTPTLTASSDSSLTVTFSSSTTGVCTITSGGLLTFVTAGTCTIDADQPGDGSYLPATTVSRSFTVRPVNPDAPTNLVATPGNGKVTVSFTPPASTGGEPVVEYAVWLSLGDGTPVAGFSTAANPFEVTGLTNGQSYYVQLTAITESSNYSDFSDPSNTFTPSADQTITFANPGDQSLGGALTVSASATSSLAVTFTSETPDVCSVTSAGVTDLSARGTCTIRADQAGNTSYLAADPVSQSFTILGQGVGMTLTASVPQFVAGDPLLLTATIDHGTPSGTVTFYDGATVLGSSGTIGNQATLSVSFPAGATPSLSARYGGSQMLEPATSNTVTLTELTSAASEELAKNLAQTRMRQLFLGQPDLMQFLRGTPEGSFGLTVSGKNGTVDWFSPDGPIWFRLSASQTTDTLGSAHYALLSFGSHRRIGDEAILGLMGQVDSIGYDDATGSGKATGWLAGPYGVARLGGLPLWLEGRLLWGQTRNNVTPDGLGTDTFDGDRFLGLVKLSGEFASDTVTLRPYLSHGVGTEALDPFTTAQGALASDNDLSRQETALGADFAWNIPVSTGALVLDGGFGLVAVQSDDGGDEGNALRFRLGLDRWSDTGLHSYFNVFGQGGGSIDASSLGADLGLELTF